MPNILHLPNVLQQRKFILIINSLKSFTNYAVKAIQDTLFGQFMAWNYTLGKRTNILG